MDKLVIGKHVIPYEERKSVRAKRIIITVFVDKVRVSVPRGATNKKVKEFVKASQEKILEHWLKLREKQAAQVPQAFQPDSAAGIRLGIPGQGMIPFLGRFVSYQTQTYQGKRCGLKVKAKSKSSSDLLMDRSIEILLPEDSSPTERPTLMKEVLIYWYKNEARKVFERKLAHYAASMGVRYGQIRLKEQKTKWGSCSGLGNINLNWQLIRAPEKVVDYVIIHELAHLKQMNHSPEFWQIVAREMPDYQVWKKWLRDRGGELVF